MVPKDSVAAWRAEAPWVLDHQVEQDLVLSRALVALFSHLGLAGGLAFRGGTALHKLYLQPAVRCCDDIDLVQIGGGNLDRALQLVHAVLDGWLGEPAVKQSEDRATLLYRTSSEGNDAASVSLKVQVSARQNLTVYGFRNHRVEVNSPWFSGVADVRTYTLDELLGLQLRALYQRKRGTDLFDLGLALQRDDVSTQRILAAFARYMQKDGVRVTRAMFEQNLAAKQHDPSFAADLTPLLARGFTWSFDSAYGRVWRELLGRLPGAPWNGA